MLSFTINSCEIGKDNVAHVNVHMVSEKTEQTVDIDIAGTEEEMATPDYVLYQIAMLAKAFVSPTQSYGNIGEQLIAETYEELPLKEENSVL